MKGRLWETFLLKSRAKLRLFVDISKFPFTYFKVVFYSFLSTHTLWLPSARWMIGLSSSAVSFLSSLDAEGRLISLMLAYSVRVM